MTEAQQPEAMADGAVPAGVPLALPPLMTREPRQRRGVLIIIGVTLVLLLCGCASLWVFAIRSVVPRLVSRIPVPALVAPSVSWVDDRFAVIQSPALGGGVVVYDDEQGAVRELKGFRLAVVEGGESVLWLHKAKPLTLERAEETEAFGNQAGDAWDEAADELYAWRCGTDDDPRRATTYQWAPWPNHRGDVVDISVSPAIGAAPCNAFVTQSKGGLVSLSPDFYRTFEPIGWSPSGRYFALVSLLHQDMAQPRPEEKDSVGDLLLDSTIRVVVYDTETGRMIDRFGLGDVRNDPVRDHVAWLPGQDVIYYHIVDDAPSDAMQALLASEFDEEGRPHPVELPDYPAEWSGANWRLIGEDGDAILVEVSGTSGDSLWRMNRNGYEREPARYPAQVVSAHVRAGRFLYMTPTSGGFSVRVGDLGSGDDREIWRSQIVPDDPFAWLGELMPWER